MVAVSDMQTSRASAAILPKQNAPERARARLKSPNVPDAVARGARDTAPKTGIVSAGRKLGGYAVARRRPDVRLKDRTRELKPRKGGSEANRSPQAETRHEMKRALPLVALLASTWPAMSSDLQINAAVTQETIATTICAPGWTKTVRPSARYTARHQDQTHSGTGNPGGAARRLRTGSPYSACSWRRAVRGAKSRIAALGRGGGEGPDRGVSLAGRLRRDYRTGRGAAAHMG